MIRKVYVIRPTLRIELSEDDINDILFTALDGGVDHWCQDILVVDEMKGTDICEQISRGGKLVFVPHATTEACELTLPKFLTGVQSWMESGCRITIEGNRIATYEEIDGNAADAIIQFALFGAYNWRRE